MKCFKVLTESCWRFTETIDAELRLALDKRLIKRKLEAVASVTIHS